ncbi:MAG TPA: hypothetical protein VLS89_20325 [Candidatus Nanopelagicales bacterium]|nr:hypothetical protein [Candidatus Nanopelagicales bacterium]
MTLPVFRPAFLRSFAAVPDVKRGLERQLLDKGIALPPMLRAGEQEEILDLLAFFLELPLRAARRLEEVTAGALWVLVEPVDEPPRGVAGAIVVGERRRKPGERHLDLPQEVTLLRDALCECVGREWSGTRLQRVAAWMGEVTDSPSTAMRFASAVLALEAREPEASDVELFLAGLAAAAGWLLAGVDARAAVWVLMEALGEKNPKSLLSAEEQAASTFFFDEEDAWQDAFDAGLVHTLADGPDDPIDLRRTLEVLDDFQGGPVAFTLEQLATALAARIAQDLLNVLDRYLLTRGTPLGLNGPVDPEILPASDALKRLHDLCAPADEVTITVLHGSSDVDRTMNAAQLSMTIADRLEPVWITFCDGPERGWQPVAAALGIDVLAPETSTLDDAGVPRWVRQAHERLKMRPCLLVVDQAHTVPEDHLAAWLPAGRGLCVVLVLSQRDERALQRARDAIAVRLE